MILPGLIVPPFADERYDDESLYARFGYGVGHELAHNAQFAASGSGAYTTDEAVHDLLRHYPRGRTTRDAREALLCGARMLVTYLLPRQSAAKRRAVATALGSAAARSTMLYLTYIAPVSAPAWGSERVARRAQSAGRAPLAVAGLSRHAAHTAERR